jgi:hypothetical protein
MTTVRIAHAEPRPGNLGDGRTVVHGFLVVLADDAGHRALPLWLSSGTPAAVASPGGRSTGHPGAGGAKQAGDKVHGQPGLDSLSELLVRTCP